VEKPPSGGCQLGDRCSNTKAWAHRAGAHGEYPMKSFEPRSMMQEHCSLIKRANTSRGNNWTTPTQISKHFDIVVPNINEWS